MGTMSIQKNDSRSAQVFGQEQQEEVEEGVWVELTACCNRSLVV
jgi:hypothetical protein